MARTKPGREAEQFWQTWWSVVGPKLPRSEIRLNRNIVLAPLSQEDFAQMKTFRAPVLSLSASTDSSVVHYPPRDEIQSRYRLQIDVEGRDADEACEIAQRIADRLLTSLTLIIPGGRYHAELRKLRRTGAEQEFTGYSERVVIAPLIEPENIEETEITRTLALFDAFERDAIAENAYVHLLSAWQLQSTSGSKPLERSVLQHYVLCMEAVVNGTMGKIRTNLSDRIRADERQFASEFAEELPRRADKPDAIRKASIRLREISLLNAIPSIAEVASMLQLPDEDAQRAKELYRFRSSSLSHPGRSKRDDFDRWLRKGPNVGDICLADHIARAFLRGYCENALRGRLAARLPAKGK